MRKRIAVAISGGIDSLMAARLLIEAGHEVTGIHFTTGYETEGSVQPAGSPSAPRPSIEGGGSSAKEVMDAISRQLGIPIEIIDIASEFRKGVVGYFTEAYQRGLTPNPCLVCNPLIKFGRLLRHAEKLGASQIATGHYARILPGENGGCRLVKGLDPRKDQSYFLAFLSQEQLAGACFPLGEMTKDRVKALAAEKGLQPVTSGESQDICFITGGRYTEFLTAQPGFTSAPGPIETVDGNRIGTHGGLHMFTVGQRRGINCPGPEPYYVIRLDPPNNRLVVGFKRQLESASCTVSGVNWIESPPEGPARLSVRLRYRHREVPATLTPIGEGGAAIRFDAPQSAVTPGQGAVFYAGDRVVGAGWIEPEP